MSMLYNDGCCLLSIIFCVDMIEPDTIRESCKISVMFLNFQRYGIF